MLLRKSRCLVFFVFALGLLLPLPAWAADGEKDSFTFTPRLWYTMHNLNVNNRNAGEQETQSEAFIPLAGATVTWKPKKLKGNELMLTVLHGVSMKSDYFNVLTDGTFAVGRIEQVRTDTELLLRRKLKDSNVTVAGGLRWVHYTHDIVLSATNFTPFFPNTGQNRLVTQVDLYLAELGVGHFTNITNNGKHRLFSNLMFGFGASTYDVLDEVPNRGDTYKATAIITWDINVGYAYTFRKDMNFNLRYRAFGVPATFAPNSPFVFTVIHGPELGLTFRF